MKSETSQLAEAREHLGAAEANLFAEDSHHHVEEGFALLEDIVSSEADEADIAENTGKAYFAKLQALLAKVLTDAATPEPVLKAVLRVTSVLDGSPFAQGSDIGELRRDAGKRLLGKYFKGYSAEEKQQKMTYLLNRLGNEDS